MFNTISIIGLGYIGLPTAALFATRKKRVIGVDVMPHVVETINQGKIHIVEPELDMLVHAAVTEGFLHATLIPDRLDREQGFNFFYGMRGTYYGGVFFGMLLHSRINDAPSAGAAQYFSSSARFVLMKASASSTIAIPTVSTTPPR